MVRLERQGDSFVMITGTVQKPDIDVLINAIAELQKISPDMDKIKEGLLYLEESAGVDLRKEIKAMLQKVSEKENRGLTVTDL